MKTALLAAIVAGIALTASGAGAAGSGTSALDEHWLKAGAQGDAFEIAGGKLALKKTHTKAVVTLAKRLVKDHTKSLDDAKKLAAKKGIKLELKPMPSQQWELKVAGSFNGGKFDYWYSSLEVMDHQQDIQETTEEATKGSDSEIKKDAQNEIPMLKTHLALAQKALKSSHK
jgi:putative membrane protein